MTHLTLPQVHASDELAEERARARPDHPCEGCGRLFTPRRIGQRHCSGPCRAGYIAAPEADRLIELLERLRPDDSGRPE
jgi:hypothetical protein